MSHRRLPRELAVIQSRVVAVVGAVGGVCSEPCERRGLVDRCLVRRVALRVLRAARERQVLTATLRMLALGAVAALPVHRVRAEREATAVSRAAVAVAVADRVAEHRVRAATRETLVSS